MVTRIVSGIVGITAAFFVITKGGWLYIFCVAALASLAWLEYARAFAKININLPRLLGALAVICLALSGINGAELSPQTFLPLSALIFTVFLFKMVFTHKSFSPAAACAAFTGIFYIGGGFFYIMQLRLGFSDLLTPAGLPAELSLLWLTLIGTWASDSFAYFTGFFFGRHKLCPAISPKKTIEGFAGGFIGTIIAVTAIGVYAGFEPWIMAFLGAGLAVIATLGDLVESMFKRYTGIKDSGTLIPGHGGVLDRFDSLIFTAPFVYYFYLFCRAYL